MFDSFTVMDGYIPVIDISSFTIRSIQIVISCACKKYNFFFSLTNSPFSLCPQMASYNSLVVNILFTTGSLQPCESPLVDHGMRDPYNLAPGAQYTLKCSPGFALPVTVSLTVKCRELRGRLTDLGVPAAELSPAASYTCFS